MKITIQDIGAQMPTGDGKHEGIQVRFDSSAVRGRAVLVATGNEVKVGQALLVETDYESCDNIESVLPQATASVKYMEATNKFVVCASISSVFEDGAFTVDVEDFRLMLEPLEGLEIRTSKWLTFHLSGLRLWEYNV